jgi:transposase
MVLRPLRGESVESLSRELGVEIYRLEKWRDKGLSGIDAALKERRGDPVQAELGAAMRRIGDLTMQNEILWQRVRKPGPLVMGRASKLAGRPPKPPPSHSVVLLAHGPLL